MGSLLKGIAIAAGAGLALGIGANIGSRSHDRKHSRPRRTWPREEVLRLEPLFDRLDGLETRLEAAEARTAPASFASLDQRVAQQESELRSLRARADETERRAAAVLELTERRVQEALAGVPALVESSLGARIRDLEERIQADTASQRQKTLAAVEQTIEQRIASRIGSLERTLADQSTSIGILRERAEQTDANLQRLIAAIEKLCEQSEPMPSLPIPEPVAVPELRPRIFAEAEPAARKARMPMARIFGAILTLGLSRSWK